MNFDLNVVLVDSTFGYNGGEDAGGKQMWSWKHKSGERGRMQGPCGNSRTVLYGDIGSPFHRL